MAIFGTIDAKALGADVTVTNGDVTVATTADFTNRATPDFIQAGDILSLGGVQYTVESVVSATELKLTTAYAGSTGTVLAANAIRRTAPKEVANLLLNESKFPAGTQFIFVDDTEADLNENKIRGLKFPGWWLYRTYTDGDGNTRHKAECIAFAHAAAVDAGDYDNDNPAADVASAISISAQPADVTGAADPFTGTFVIGASADSGSLIFQWQRQTATSTRWVNITGSLDGGVYSGQTASTLTVTGAAKADLDGYKFRVKLTSDAGAEEVISDAATLTFA